MSKLYELVLRRSIVGDKQNTGYLREITIERETTKQFKIGKNSLCKSRIRKEPLSDLGYYVENSYMDGDFTTIIFGEENIPNAINNALLLTSDYYEKAIEETKLLKRRLEVLEDLARYMEVKYDKKDNN